MNADFDGEMTRRMDEASLLPADHPRRQQVRDEVAAAGDSVQQQWLELQRENEELASHLQEVTPPSGLTDRLLRIPEASPRRPMRVRVMLAAAAAIIIISAAAVIAIVQPASQQSDRAVSQLASLVAQDHMAQPKLTVVESDWNDAVASLQSSSPFRIQLPSKPDGAALVGARICSFDDGPLVYSRWTDVRGNALSVYQLRLSDFGIPAHLPPKTIIPHSGTASADPCRVRLWSDDDFAYAVVTNRPHGSGS